MDHGRREICRSLSFVQQFRSWRFDWARSDTKPGWFPFLQGSESSSQILQSLAHDLCEAFVNGELCVGDWAPDQGAKINVNLVFWGGSRTFVNEGSSSLAYAGTYVEKTGTYSPGRIVRQGSSVSCDNHPRCGMKDGLSIPEQ